MFNLNLKTIPHRDQRYDVLGDYWTEGGVIQFRVSSIGAADYEFLIFIEALIEKQLARRMGITEQMIEAWDLAHEDEPDAAAREDCPYRDAFLIAQGFQRAIATKLGVNWSHFEESQAAVLRDAMVPPDPTVIDAIDRGEFIPPPMRARYNANRPLAKPTAKEKARSVLRGKKS